MTKKVHIGEVSLIYTLKRKSFYLIVLASKVSRNSTSKMIKRSSIRYFTTLESLIRKINLIKITLVTLKFSIAEYKRLKKVDKLSKTTVDLMHLINEYGKKHNLRSEVDIQQVDNQMIHKDTSGMYQTVFHVN